MKRLAHVLIASSWFFSLAPTRAVEIAQARLYSLSFKVYLATNIYGDQFKISSTGAADRGLWELSPSQPPDAEITLPGMNSYGSGVWFYDSGQVPPYWDNYGTLYLNPPDFTDLNNNKFPDFFEVSLGVTNATSAGSYNCYDPVYLEYFYGNIYATWNRAAGSKTGTVAMQIVDSVYGPYLDIMYAAFEILEYKGTLAYTPGATLVSGTLDVTQTGSNATFTGSMQFVKSDTNRFNSLILQPGVLTDQSAQATTFTNRYFFRDVNWPTNYGGYVQFDNDGDIGTYYPFAVWVLSIDDTNDANHNGVPDFSDDASAPPPRQPLLGLTVTTSNSLLSISGDINHVVKIQQSLDLTFGSWTDVTSFTLTNPTVLVPLTAGSGASFWRVLTQ